MLVFSGQKTDDTFFCLKTEAQPRTGKIQIRSRLSYQGLEARDRAERGGA